MKSNKFEIVKDLLRLYSRIMITPSPRDEIDSVRPLQHAASPRSSITPAGDIVTSVTSLVAEFRKKEFQRDNLSCKQGIGNRSCILSCPAVPRM